MKPRGVIGSLVLAGVLTGCGGAAKATQPTTPESVGLVLDVEPATAEVDIDGTVRGVASNLAGTIALEPGAHQIVIRSRGFETWRGEVEISDRVERIQVQLVTEQ